MLPSSHTRKFVTATADIIEGYQTPIRRFVELGDTQYSEAPETDGEGNLRPQLIDHRTFLLNACRRIRSTVATRSIQLETLIQSDKELHWSSFAHWSEKNMTAGRSRCQFDVATQWQAVLSPKVINYSSDIPHNGRTHVSPSVTPYTRSYLREPKKMSVLATRTTYQIMAAITYLHWLPHTSHVKPRLLRAQVPKLKSGKKYRNFDYLFLDNFQCHHEQLILNR